MCMRYTSNLWILFCFKMHVHADVTLTARGGIVAHPVMQAYALEDNYALDELVLVRCM